jgi:hypothetical protein
MNVEGVLACIGVLILEDVGVVGAGKETASSASSASSSSAT